ncbi:thioesterase family protein [Bradyrhizobium sp. USDA 4508]
MKRISTGTTGRFTLVVKPEHLANRFKDSILPPVLATPVMIMAMENAALNAVRDYLEPGESVVGTMVNVQHLAATVVGQTVTAMAEVTQRSTAAGSHFPSAPPMKSRKLARGLTSGWSLSSPNCENALTKRSRDPRPPAPRRAETGALHTAVVQSRN